MPGSAVAHNSFETPQSQRHDAVHCDTIASDHMWRLASAKDYAALPHTEMRRANRAVIDGDWIRTHPTGVSLGSLATADNTQPFLNSTLYPYDGNRPVLFLHEPNVGRTMAADDPAEAQGASSRYWTNTLRIGVWGTVNGRSPLAN